MTLEKFAKYTLGWRWLCVGPKSVAILEYGALKGMHAKTTIWASVVLRHLTVSGQCLPCSQMQEVTVSGSLLTPSGIIAGYIFM